MFGITNQQLEWRKCTVFLAETGFHWCLHSMPWWCLSICSVGMEAVHYWRWISWTRMDSDDGWIWMDPMDGYDTHFRHFQLIKHAPNQQWTRSGHPDSSSSSSYASATHEARTASWHHGIVGRRPPVCFDSHEDGKPSVAILSPPSRKGAGAIPKYMYWMN